MAGGGLATTTTVRGARKVLNQEKIFCLMGMCYFFLFLGATTTARQNKKERNIKEKGKSESEKIIII